jgi:acetolactate synthase I/II/III large subunit
VKEGLDGGEAILEAFRNLGIDYIISSPGSEWAPVWEALARQQVNETAGPRYINCWHESLAVAMAQGYTRATGRLQAVLLHAGAGLLQGSIAIHGTQLGEVPMLVCSGEALSYGDDPEFDPGMQWYRNLSVVGGPQRFVEPVVKWANQATSPYTLYEMVVRAAEMAQRVPKGPTYLNIPLETMLHSWTPPTKMGKVPPAPKTRLENEAVDRVAKLLLESSNPLIVTESSGQDPEAFRYLVQLAELLSIPVVENSGPSYANFPKDHPLHLGFDVKPFLDHADLVLVVGNRVPWYPPSSGPANGTVVVIDENPIKSQMVYQSLQADAYLEGDIATALRMLTEAVQSSGSIDADRVSDRKARWESEHNKLQEGYHSSAAAAQEKQPIDPVWLCAAISEAMPQDTIYVDETIVHRPAILQHVQWSQPQSYFHPNGGLGQGLGLALGVKLARPERPVVALMGDGSFLYNPITQSLGVSREASLPILIIVFNNGCYASMRRNHLSFYPQGDSATSGIFYGVNIPGPNYAQLVEPFGGYAERVEDPSKLKPALRHALEAVKGGNIALVDVVLEA